MDTALSASGNDVVLFSNLVMLLGTSAFVGFLLVLPKQPKLHHVHAIRYFIAFFLCGQLAFFLYVMRFWDLNISSVVSNNVIYLLGIYLFYFGIRSRYQQPINRQLITWSAAHLLLTGLCLYYFSAVQDHLYFRLAIILTSVCLPIALAWWCVTRYGRQDNPGDKALKICCIVALIILPLLLPILEWLFAPGLLMQVYINALVTLSLEILCIGGLAISYIYDLVNKLKFDANTDKLTMTRNRRYFFKVAPGLISEAKQQQQNMILILADIDHFKKINDIHGHQQGDLVLSYFADQLLTLLKPQDLCVRYGGEEFLILLHHQSLLDGTVLMERLRYQLRKQPCPTASGSLHITASFGVIEVNGGMNLEQAIAQADLALYRAKAKGRDRIETVFQISA